ncbi:MAG TPA: hypothetical protein VL463_10905 [Kofleriaceae bacterium]|nr:hypothetical protein [Kofleriaceae bacterium]
MFVVAAGCSSGHSSTQPDGPVTSGSDADGDGVPDGMDKCADTPAGQPVNMMGCADGQLKPMREKNFPPYGLTFTETGDAGRVGGLTWAYTNINRADLFHIWWIPCDDLDTPCGLSLAGPINSPSETWIVSASQSDFPGGKFIFTDTTKIALADGTSASLPGRLTLTIVDANSAPIPISPVATLGVTTRLGSYGVEILGTAYTVQMLIEVQDPSTQTWTPYLDYYDAQPKPDPAAGTAVSFDASFYDK